MSILIDCKAEADNPAPFVAEHCSVTPAVSAVRLVVAQPEDDAIPDSGSLTIQLTVTLLVYQPLLPKVPVISGAMIGGVVSELPAATPQSGSPSPAGLFVRRVGMDPSAFTV